MDIREMRAPSGRVFLTYSDDERVILARFGWELVEVIEAVS